MNNQAEAQVSDGDKEFKPGTNEYALLAATPNGSEEQGGLAVAEKPETSLEKTLERSDVESLINKAGELRGISEVQYGLELSIIGGGLQTMADRYGADKLLDALLSKNPPAMTIAEVATVLAPDKKQRQALFEAIKDESIEALGEKLNETVGGVTVGIDAGTDALARFRHYEMIDIEKGKPTDGSNLLLTGHLVALLEGHPELAENFRETNDTFELLKGIRAMYETEYAQYTTDIEATLSQIEALVTKGETSIAELLTISDDIFADEVALLEERIKTTTNPEAVTMVQTILDKKQADARLARDELAQRSEAMRSKIINDLGASSLTGMRGTAPIRPQPTHPPYDHY
jgi:hypothetical protein